MQADVLGIVTASRERATFFAERHPALARRIKGLPPMLIAEQCRPVPVRAPEPEPQPREMVADDLGRWTPAPRPTPGLIIKIVCNAFGVTPDEIMCRSRTNRLARPRMACYALVSEFCRIGPRGRTLSMPELGRLFRRDHTSILSGLRRVRIMVEKNPAFADRYAAARAELVAP